MIYCFRATYVVQVTIRVTAEVSFFQSVFSPFEIILVHSLYSYCISLMQYFELYEFEKQFFCFENFTFI